MLNSKSKFDNFGYQLGLRNENTSIATVFNGYDIRTNPITPINNLKNNKSWYFSFCIFKL